MNLSQEQVDLLWSLACAGIVASIVVAMVFEHWFVDDPEDWP